MELVFLRRRMYISFHSFYCLFIAVNDMAKIERRPKKRREIKKCPQTWCGPDWERSDESFWKSWNNIYAMLNELFDWCIISAGRDNVVRMAHAASIRLLPHIRHSIIIRIPSRKIKKIPKNHQMINLEYIFPIIIQKPEVFELAEIN